MLEVLSNGFNKAKDRLKGRIALTEENIEESLKDIRLSLLEADVNLPIVRKFLSRVKEKAIGETVETRVSHDGKKIKVSAGDHFIGICQAELEALMGPVDTTINYRSKPVSSIMLLGLQGCGKTTTAGKLAGYLKKNHKKPLLVAADIYRPAAVEQLKVIGNSLDIPVFARENTAPPELCRQAVNHARETGCDVAIFDTAGRLAIDNELMTELEAITSLTSPDNTFLVCDAMTGQDAVKTAGAFNRRLPLSGFILTKLDGDARGGAALSIKEVTGTPIKFLGTGEAFDRLEEFRPEGLASRILGFGDVVGLMKDFEEVIDEKKAEEDAQKMLKGQFTLIDFIEQIQAIKKMGPLQDLVEKIPFFKQMTGGGTVEEGEIVKVESIINSMTPKERTRPEILNDSRKKRISKGCGRSIKDINELLKRFKMMRTMMKNMGKSGLLGKIGSGLSNIPGLGGGNGGLDMAGLMSGGGMQLPKRSAKTMARGQKKKSKDKRKQAKKSRKKGRKK